MAFCRCMHIMDLRDTYTQFQHHFTFNPEQATVDHDQLQEKPDLTKYHKINLRFCHRLYYTKNQINSKRKSQDGNEIDSKIVMRLNKTSNNEFKLIITSKIFIHASWSKLLVQN